MCVIFWIIDSQWLVVVLSIFVARNTATRVAATNNRRQSKSVIAVIVTNENSLYVGKTIANGCSSTFTTIKKDFVLWHIAPRAIKCLAKNRNVEFVIHKPNIVLLFIECQGLFYSTLYVIFPVVGSNVNP